MLRPIPGYVPHLARPAAVPAPDAARDTGPDAGVPTETGQELAGAADAAEAVALLPIRAPRRRRRRRGVAAAAPAPRRPALPTGHVTPAPAVVPPPNTIPSGPRAGLTGGIPGISLPPVEALPRLPIGSQRLSLQQYRQLYAMALETPELAWPLGRDIGLARNAHNTNTPEEMADALSNNYDWFEGDVRIDRNGTVIMAHDKADTRGMSLEEWLAIGAAAGRGLKLDFKAWTAIMPALQAVKRHGIPDQRLNINVTVHGDADATVSTAMLRRIRRMFPKATINLSVSVQGYTQDVLARMARAARIVGQPAMFPLRVDLVNRHVVATLRQYGKVAIWNSPNIYSPADPIAERERLRSLGVDGTIDLRAAGGLTKVSAQFFNAAVNIFGWTATLQALRAVSSLKRFIGIF